MPYGYFEVKDIQPLEAEKKLVIVQELETIYNMDGPQVRKEVETWSDSLLPEIDSMVMVAFDDMLAPTIDLRHYFLRGSFDVDFATIPINPPGGWDLAGQAATLGFYDPLTDYVKKLSDYMTHEIPHHICRRLREAFNKTVQVFSRELTRFLEGRFKQDNVRPDMDIAKLIAPLCEALVKDDLLHETLKRRNQERLNEMSDQSLWGKIRAALKELMFASDWVGKVRGAMKYAVRENLDLLDALTEQNRKQLISHLKKYAHECHDRVKQTILKQI